MTLQMSRSCELYMKKKQAAADHRWPFFPCFCMLFSFLHDLFTHVFLFPYCFSFISSFDSFTYLFVYIFIYLPINCPFNQSLRVFLISFFFLRLLMVYLPTNHLFFFSSVPFFLRLSHQSFILPCYFPFSLSRAAFRFFLITVFDCLFFFISPKH